MAKDEKTRATDTPAGALTNGQQNAGLETLAQASTDWLGTLTDLGHETARFTTDRVKTGLQTRDAMLQAKDIAEVQHIQSCFLLKAVEDYTTQGARLMEMMKTLTPLFPAPLFATLLSSDDAKSGG